MYKLFTYTTGLFIMLGLLTTLYGCDLDAVVEDQERNRIQYKKKRSDYAEEACELHKGVFRLGIRIQPGGFFTDSQYGVICKDGTSIPWPYGYYNN